MSYWTFTDIFEEAGPRATPFHGGFGLLNYQGIRKPSFFAYQFLRRLGDRELKTGDAESWVCEDGAGGVQALFWDFTITHPGPSVINQDYYDRDLPSAPARSVRLALHGMKPGRYSLSAYRVGYRANDAYTAYLAMGAPKQLTRAQVAELKKVASGAPFAEEGVEVGADGSLERIYSMRQNDAVLVTLK
jgi:xylan 1,4-beta-xylosidase